jgi:hypothetical protein
MPSLLESERQYLREHPDAIMDPGNQKRLEAAYLDAQRDGIERGSDSYFAFMDERLGYDSGSKASNKSGGGARRTVQTSRDMPKELRDAESRLAAEGVKLTIADAAKISGLTLNEYRDAAKALQDAREFAKQSVA